MQNLTYDNHINWGWSGNKFRTDENDIYSINYKRNSRENLNLYEESKLVCEQIYQQSNNPIAVMLSGGVDSEWICRILLDLKIPFSCIYSKYKMPYWQDQTYAYKFCEANNLKLHLIELDEIDILTNKLWYYADIYKIDEPNAIFDIIRLEKSQGLTTIFGGGDPIIETHNNKLMIIEEAKFQYAKLYQSEYQIPSCYQFFQSSGELILSFLNDPIMKEFVRTYETIKWDNSIYWKAYMYKNYFPAMQYRYKCTGYEAFSQQYLKARGKLQEKYKYKKSTALIQLNDIVDQLKYQ